MELLPATDEGQITISLKMPKGTRIEETNRTTLEAEALLAEFKDIEKVTTSIGANIMSFDAVSADSATMSLNLVEKDYRAQSTDENAELIRQKLNQIPGAEFSVSTSSLTTGGMSSGGGITINIYGDEIPVLMEISDTYTQKLSEVPSLREVKSTYESGKPEVSILVDRQKAAAFGLTGSAVASYVKTAMGGQVATTMKRDGAEIDVTVALPDSEFSTLEQLTSLLIQTPAGAFIPLSSVVKTERTSQNFTISRENQKRYISISASIFGADLGTVTEDIKAKLDGVALPAGYSYVIGGDYETMMDSFNSLALALLLAILLIYMVMAAQFESLIYPFIIMFTLPLAFTGSILALAIGGKTLNIPSFIGVIMLAGIVVNNAIVLIDYIIQKRKEGMSAEEATVFAGPRRLRPILMTSLTTILGLLPLALAAGEGTELQAPMSILVIGGLISSTFLTLIVIPTIYMMIAHRQEKRRRKKENKKNKKAKELLEVTQ
jgi:HAE1 family hydrophobic/amphiphilic exporter-1